MSLNEAEVPATPGRDQEDARREGSVAARGLGEGPGAAKLEPSEGGDECRADYEAEDGTHQARHWERLAPLEDGARRSWYAGRRAP